MTGARGGVAGRVMGRRWIVWAVLGAALVLLLASSLTVWVKRQALETDNWVETSSQLLENDEVELLGAGARLEEAREVAAGA